MRTVSIPLVLSALTLCACSSGSSASRPAPVAPAAPSPGTGRTGDPPSPTGAAASARALPAGPPISFTIGCAADFLVGPFELARSGDTVGLAGTNRSVDGSQLCAPAAEWVDATGAVVAPAGFGCAEGPDATTSELTYEYSPDNGGNAANPVYLHIRREDPEGCVASEITLARR